MATLTIKNLPDDLYSRLKRRAAANRRSMNSEAILCFEEVLLGLARDDDDLLQRVRRLREAIGIYVTDAAIRAAIDEDRP